ncbi:MAG TPA: 4a-hydroxytetrahydrobiopterin dehydratase [Dehalococcoidia bacterium]|nr:4a-hydroxytetrahydrobiopterin dehydratase [Dehalococcoidia bacterium]
MAKLNDDEIARQASRVPEWTREGDAIRREFRFKDFVRSMGFVNQVALLAEKADHHPDIAVSYNRVGLELSTHSEGGLTARDFDLAAQIDALI